MPITPSYTWHESPSWVAVHVSLRSVSSANIDILTTDCYIKVNCAPYLFQIDLFGDVDARKSSAVVDNGTVRFLLIKKQDCFWGRLTAIGDRSEILLRRESSLESERQRTKQVKEDLKVKRAQLGRLAVQNQMKLDESKRNIVEERKAAELKSERDMIEVWQKGIRSQLSTRSKFSSETLNLLNSENGDTNMSSHSHALLDETSSDTNNLNNPASICQEHRTPDMLITGHTKASSTASINCILPEPRKRVSVSVKFTPKSLSPNLPARESRDVVQLKNKIVTESDSIDISEREPLFLQDKGDRFYEKGNFSSAINAYTDAVNKDPSLFLSFANRAGSYLHLKKFEQCVVDCTKALHLLENEELLTIERVSTIEGLTEISANGSCECASVDVRDVMRPVLQECQTLLCRQNMSYCKDVTRWYRSAEKHILVRRAIALCNMDELEKAKSDFEKVISRNLSEKEMDEISTLVHEISVGA